MWENQSTKEAIQYYKSRGAPGDQQELVQLLQEIQENNGGAIPQKALEEISESLDIKETFLRAIIKRYKSLCTVEAPHRLELCGGERCQKRNCLALHRFIKESYGVQSGETSEKWGFSFKITGCMKNCPKGPSLKWDKKLYCGADTKLIRRLVENGGKEQ